MEKRGRAIAILVLLLSATYADAQAVHVPTLEVGIHAGLVGLVGADAAQPRVVVGPRLTLNLSQRGAIDLGTDTIPFQGTWGFYFLRYKHMVHARAHGTATPFVTAGAGGSYFRGFVGEHRTSRADGSVAIVPAHSTGKLSGLNFAVFGGGIESQLNKWLAARVEGEALASIYGGFAFRFLAGLSIPIGGYRAD
jgi:hypothetical protein